MDETELPVVCPYVTGDLLKTLKELAIRKDGLTFGEDDADEKGKVPKDWLVGSDDIPAGTFCTFIRQAQEDEGYAIVQRDLMGRMLIIRFSLLELVSSIDEAVEADASVVDEGEGTKCNLT